MDEFEWDERKRKRVLDKHGLDFLDAIRVFAAPHIRVSGRSEMEERQLAIGIVQGVEIAVVFSMRGTVCRIITARRARHDERKAYHAHLSGRSEIADQ